jgi:hypothetical protein
MTHPEYSAASPRAESPGRKRPRKSHQRQDPDPDPDESSARAGTDVTSRLDTPPSARVSARAASGKISLAPVDEADGRSLRARVEPMAVRPLRDGRYVVQTDGGTYVVDLDRRSCTCPDHAIRGARCKHLRRVAIEVTEGLVAPPGHRRSVCAVCGRETFVPMSATGPQLCARHRFEPGTAVRDRETGSTLVVVSEPGARADEARTAEGRVVADYESNAAYGGHEPVVDCVYLADVGTRTVGGVDAVDLTGARRYSFPASRLRRRRGRPFRFRLVDTTSARDRPHGTPGPGRTTLTADTAP